MPREKRVKERLESDEREGEAQRKEVRTKCRKTER